MKIILTELIANKKNLFLTTQMIKEEKFLNNWVKNTKYSSDQWKKFETYIFNCCITYLIKRLHFTMSVSFQLKIL